MSIHTIVTDSYWHIIVSHYTVDIGPIQAQYRPSIGPVYVLILRHHIGTLLATLHSQYRADSGPVSAQYNAYVMAS